MPTAVDFIFDFGSPNAYLVHQVLPGITTRTGAKFNYIPCLLGGIFKATGNQPPWQAFADVPQKLNYEQIEMQRFIALHKLTRFTMNPHFPVVTLLLMRGAVAAEMDGRLAEYVDAGTCFMWEDGLKMDDTDVYTKAFDGAGFDGAALLEKTQDQKIKDKLMANTQAAIERGVFGIPTFFAGDDMFFGKERLGQLEACIKNA